MPNDEEESKFTDAIRAAFESYPQPRPSPDFEAQFWTNFEARRGRYRGFLWFWRRLIEIEIEGVAVWRLALSTVSGGASCALFFALAIGFSGSEAAAPFAPDSRPQNQNLLTPLNAFAFTNREWDDEFLVPRPKPKTAPPKARKKGGDFSWTGSNAPLA